MRAFLEGGCALSRIAQAHLARSISIHELNRGTAGMCAGSTPDPSVRAGWRLLERHHIMSEQVVLSVQAQFDGRFG